MILLGLGGYPNLTLMYTSLGVQRYNEDFPLTEASIQNVLQPQQQIVNTSVPAPTEAVVEMDLKSKLNTLTKDDTIIIFTAIIFTSRAGREILL